MKLKTKALLFAGLLFSLNHCGNEVSVDTDFSESAQAAERQLALSEDCLQNLCEDMRAQLRDALEMGSESYNEYIPEDAAKYLDNAEDYFPDLDPETIEMGDLRECYNKSEALQFCPEADEIADEQNTICFQFNCETMEGGSFGDVTDNGEAISQTIGDGNMIGLSQSSSSSTTCSDGVCQTTRTSETTSAADIIRERMQEREAENDSSGSHQNPNNSNSYVPNWRESLP